MEALIDYAVTEEQADPDRVRLIGVSRGGMLAFWALDQLGGRIKAAAIFIASMPAHIRNGYKLSKPVHILLMNGTKDPLIFYEEVQANTVHSMDDVEKYRQLPTEQVVKDLAAMQGLPAISEVKRLSNKKSDDCRVEHWEWKGTPKKGSVTLVKVIGGGHTISGIPQLLPKTLVGPTCWYINGYRLAIDFLNKLP